MPVGQEEMDVPFGVGELVLVSFAAIPYLLIAAAIVAVVVKTLKIAKAVDEISSSMRVANRQLQKITDALGEQEARQSKEPEQPESE